MDFRLSTVIDDGGSIPHNCPQQNHDNKKRDNVSLFFNMYEVLFI